MKLELKHLAPYLPYGLKVQYVGSLDDNNGGYFEISIDQIKPILRPLSDLTKEQFNHIWNEETDFLSIELIVGMDAESFSKSEFTLGFYNSLFEHHFDVFGLIPEGLAIDINTLKL